MNEIGPMRGGYRMPDTAGLSSFVAGPAGRIRRMVSLAALTAFAAAAPPIATARAQETGAAGTITGRVTEEGGVPLENVQIYIVEVGRDTRTGANGTYRLG